RSLWPNFGTNRNFQTANLTRQQKLALRRAGLGRVRDLLGAMVHWIEFRANNYINIENKNPMTSGDRNKYQRDLKVAITYIVSGGDVGEIKDGQNKTPYGLDPSLRPRENLRRVVRLAVPYVAYESQRAIYSRPVAETLVDILTDMYWNHHE